MMTPEEELHLRDTIGDALRVVAGVSKALGYIDETSSDYHMHHVLADTLDVEVRKSLEAFPESWEEGLFDF